MNEAEVQKMKTAFLKSGLSVKEATTQLTEAKNQVDKEAAEKARQEFLSGLWFRNFLAFIFFVILFLVFLNALGAQF